MGVILHLPVELSVGVQGVDLGSWYLVIRELVNKRLETEAGSPYREISLLLLI